MLNQVQARSARLNGAAGSLGERAVALKMADVLALPAIVLRNDQQDAIGVGLGVMNTRRAENRRRRSAAYGDGSGRG